MGNNRIYVFKTKDEGTKDRGPAKDQTDTAINKFELVKINGALSRDRGPLRSDVGISGARRRHRIPDPFTQVRNEK